MPKDQLRRFHCLTQRETMKSNNLSQVEGFSPRLCLSKRAMRVTYIAKKQKRTASISQILRYFVPAPSSKGEYPTVLSPLRGLIYYPKYVMLSLFNPPMGHYKYGGGFEQRVSTIGEGGHSNGHCHLGGSAMSW